MQEKINLGLEGYRTIVFEKERCEIYFKGSIVLEKDSSFVDWAASIVQPVNEDEGRFLERLSISLKEISGTFSLIIRSEDTVYLASDIIRCYPVFYGFAESGLFITDNLDRFQNANGSLLIDNSRLEEYISSGYVYSNGTIFKDAFATQAGEIVTVRDRIIRSIRYFQFKPSSKQMLCHSITDFSKSLDKVLLSDFRKLVDSNPEVNRWIVPLSGGHDSRIIVNYLYRLGIRNVICYSYGVPGNEQSMLSKRVADALGYEWHFVEYTEQKWHDLHETGIIEDFLGFAFNGVSIPHLQDFLAVCELKKNEIIRSGDVFLPGHAFDFLVGSNLEPEDIRCNSKAMSIRRTLNMHTKIKGLSGSPVKAIEEIYESAGCDYVHFQEYFNWQEKRAKFLANACKGYEFFGFEARLPFWFQDIVDFWLSVPDEFRMERKIFLEAEYHGILIDSLALIPFYGKDDRVIRNKNVDLLKKIIPNFVKTFILRVTGHKTKYNAGLNQIYARETSTVRGFLEPLEDFPENVRPYFRDFLKRYPFQIDYHFMTSLYCVRRQFNK